MRLIVETEVTARVVERWIVDVDDAIGADAVAKQGEVGTDLIEAGEVLEVTNDLIDNETDRRVITVEELR